YAVPTILGELKRYFRDSGWAVHVPRGMQERVLKLDTAAQELHRRTGRSPSPKELAQELELTEEEVLEAMEAASAHDAVSRAQLVGAARSRPDALEALTAEIESCRLCPRLVAWRESVAADPPRRHKGERYWARPLPGFGDPGARVVIIGLAPAANGGNRTGRI